MSARCSVLETRFSALFISLRAPVSRFRILRSAPRCSRKTTNLEVRRTGSVFTIAREQNTLRKKTSLMIVLVMMSVALGPLLALALRGRTMYHYQLLVRVQVLRLCVCLLLLVTASLLVCTEVVMAIATTTTSCATTQ